MLRIVAQVAGVDIREELTAIGNVEQQCVLLWSNPGTVGDQAVVDREVRLAACPGHVDFQPAVLVVEDRRIRDCSSTDRRPRCDIESQAIHCVVRDNGAGDRWRQVAPVDRIDQDPVRRVVRDAGATGQSQGTGWRIIQAQANTGTIADDLCVVEGTMEIRQTCGTGEHTIL